MAQFRFRLAALQRYREHLRDVCRQQLAELLAKDAALVQQRDAYLEQRTGTLREMRDLQQRTQLDVDQQAARRYHAGQLVVDARLIEWQRQQLAELIAASRQKLVLADQSVKVLEQLSDKQRQEFDYRQEHVEARLSEEAWQAGKLIEASSKFQKPNSK
jgi:hypothetical protein